MVSPVGKKKADVRTTTRDVWTQHMIYLILAMLRDQKGMDEAVGQRRLGWPLGRALIGSNVLIVGFGALGSELAVRLQPFGVNMTAVRRSVWQSPPTGAAAALHDRAHTDQLLSLLPAADVVVLTCTMVCTRLSPPGV
jgi:phosphoglycerate dehydrogenase-like enzyme